VLHILLTVLFDRLIDGEKCWVTRVEILVVGRHHGPCSLSPLVEPALRERGSHLNLLFLAISRRIRLPPDIDSRGRSVEEIFL